MRLTTTVKKMRKFSFAKIRVIATVFVLIAASLPTPPAHAAALSTAFVRFDRMKTSEPTTGTICAKPATASTEADVQVTFPTGYGLGLAATFTVTTTNLAWPTGGTAWLGIGTATDVTGQVVTFPSTDLTVGTLYCFNWTSTSAVSIKSSATSSNTGTITTRASGPTAIDTSGYSTASVSGDQINVSATVPSTFTFAIDNPSDALGTLTTSGINSSPTPRTVTISTNAGSGWQVWAKDANTGLTSTAASKTIASRTPGTNSTLTTGEGYNTGITTSQVGGTGTVTVATPFVGGVSGKGGGLDTTLRSLASSNGTADTAVLTVTNNVTISALTPAANDYADTITVVGAGLFYVYCKAQ
jgi:hypothetical protein